MARTREVVAAVDWPCETLHEYADRNLGCGARVSSGLDWVFDVVDEAIVIEDDCLPHPSFFRFAEAMLACYRDDERIGMIAGNELLLRPCAARELVLLELLPGVGLGLMVTSMDVL